MSWKPAFQLKAPTKIFLRHRKGDAKDIYFSLNLNQYRNTHYRVLSQAKREYSSLIKSLMPKVDKFKPPYKIIYTLFRTSKRKIDIANVLSVVDKFFCDAMVDMKIFEDDDSTKLVEIGFKSKADIDETHDYVFIEVFKKST